MNWNIADKTVLVTGATNGIGLEAAVELSRRGAKVVLVGRNEAKLRAALDQVKTRSTSEKVSSLLCDFASQKSIRQLAEEFRKKHRELHVLINNAGGVTPKRTLTEDGIEMTFAVNHLGYFLLTTLLLDMLKASAPSRVVSVASIGHYRGTLDLDDVGYERSGYFILKAYARSKLCNVLFANELARRLEGTGVTSNSVHPGGVSTGIWNKGPTWARPFISAFMRPFMLSAEEGGRTLVQLAAAPELENVTGCYFSGGKAVTPSKSAQDVELARRLWDLSVRLTTPEASPSPR